MFFVALLSLNTAISFTEREGMSGFHSEQITLVKILGMVQNARSTERCLSSRKSPGYPCPSTPRTWNSSPFFMLEHRRAQRERKPPTSASWYRIGMHER